VPVFVVAALVDAADPDQAGATLAIATGKVDRDMVLLGELENRLGVAAGDGVNGLVLVHRTGKGDIGHAGLLVDGRVGEKTQAGWTTMLPPRICA
jgi:hypothetical protein